MALSWPPGFAPMMGWVPAGPVLLRLDVAERVAAELGYLTRRAAAPLPPEILGRFGIKGDALAPVLTELGFRLIPSEPLPEGEEGPVLPTMVAWARPAQPPRQQRHQRPAKGDAPAQGQEAHPPRRDGLRRDRPNRSGPPRGERPAQAPVEGQPTTPQGAHAPRPEGQRSNGPRPEGGHSPRPEGGFRKDGPRRDGPPRNGPPRGDAPRGDGPRREGPRRDGPPRDRDRGPGGPETRTFHEDRPSSKVEDSPFAALMKLKLK